MAYVATPNPLNDQTEQTGQVDGINNNAPQNTNAPAPNTSVTQAQTQPQSSGMFTNIQKYLNANQGGAQNLGQQVSNNLQQQATTATNQFNNANTAFNQQLNQASIFNPSAQYSGPASFYGSDPGQQAYNAYNQAQQAYNLSSTSAGQQQLLAQNNPNNTAGGNQLNQFLVSNSPAQQGIQQQRQNLQNIGQQFTTQAAANETAAQKAQTNYSNQQQQYNQQQLQQQQDAYAAQQKAQQDQYNSNLQQYQQQVQQQLQSQQDSYNAQIKAMQDAFNQAMAQSQAGYNQQLAQIQAPAPPPPAVAPPAPQVTSPAPPPTNVTTQPVPAPPPQMATIQPVPTNQRRYAQSASDFTSDYINNLTTDQAGQITDDQMKGLSDAQIMALYQQYKNGMQFSPDVQQKFGQLDQYLGQINAPAPSPAPAATQQQFTLPQFQEFNQLLQAQAPGPAPPPPAQIEPLNLTANTTSKQVGATDVSNLTPDVINQLSMGQIRGITLDQLKGMTYDQLSALNNIAQTKGWQVGNTDANNAMFSFNKDLQKLGAQQAATQYNAQHDTYLKQQQTAAQQAQQAQQQAANQAKQQQLTTDVNNLKNYAANNLFNDPNSFQALTADQQGQVQQAANGIIAAVQNGQLDSKTAQQNLDQLKAYAASYSSKAIQQQQAQLYAQQQAQQAQQTAAYRNYYNMLNQKDYLARLEQGNAMPSTTLGDIIGLAGMAGTAITGNPMFANIGGSMQNVGGSTPLSPTLTMPGEAKPPPSVKGPSAGQQIGDIAKNAAINWGINALGNYIFSDENLKQDKKKLTNADLDKMFSKLGYYTRDNK